MVLAFCRLRGPPCSPLPFGRVCPLSSINNGRNRRKKRSAFGGGSGLSVSREQRAPSSSPTMQRSPIPLPWHRARLLRLGFKLCPIWLRGPHAHHTDNDDNAKVSCAQKACDSKNGFHLNAKIAVRLSLPVSLLSYFSFGLCSSYRTSRPQIPRFTSSVIQRKIQQVGMRPERPVCRQMRDPSPAGSPGRFRGMERKAASATPTDTDTKPQSRRKDRGREEIEPVAACAVQDEDSARTHAQAAASCLFLFRVSCLLPPPVAAYLNLRLLRRHSCRRQG